MTQIECDENIKNKEDENRLKKIHVALNLAIMVVDCRAFLRAFAAILTKVILNMMPFAKFGYFSAIRALSSWRYCLNGLKHDISNGCILSEVCDGILMMSISILMQVSSAVSLTWLQCPSKIRRCLVLLLTPRGTFHLKCSSQSYKISFIIQPFSLTFIVASNPHSST